MALDDVVANLSGGGKLNPDILLNDTDAFLKSKMTSKECQSFAISDALQAFLLAPDEVNIIEEFKERRRQYSRTENGWQTEKYVGVLEKRIEVQDRKTRIVTSEDDAVGSAIVG